MKKSKKVIFIVLAAVLVVGATLGAVTIAQADDQNTQTSQTLKTTLFDRVAKDYQANTGTAIDAAALQTAFTQAGKELATEAQDKMWQKLIDEGKITQAQLDAYKAWLAERPALNTDAMKQWLESKPEGVSFGPGMRAPAAQRGLNRMGNMFRNFCAPDATAE